MGNDACCGDEEGCPELGSCCELSGLGGAGCCEGFDGRDGGEGCGLGMVGMLGRLGALGGMGLGYGGSRFFTHPARTSVMATAQKAIVVFVVSICPSRVCAVLYVCSTRLGSYLTFKVIGLLRTQPEIYLNNPAPDRTPSTHNCPSVHKRHGPGDSPANGLSASPFSQCLRSGAYAG